MDILILIIILLMVILTCVTIELIETKYYYNQDKKRLESELIIQKKKIKNLEKSLEEEIDINFCNKQIIIGQKQILNLIGAEIRNIEISKPFSQTPTQYHLDPISEYKKSINFDKTYGFTFFTKARILEKIENINNLQQK